MPHDELPRDFAFAGGFEHEKGDWIEVARGDGKEGPVHKFLFLNQFVFRSPLKIG